jgi:hypothetical protein
VGRDMVKVDRDEVGHVVESCCEDVERWLCGVR